eukprot:scaffold21360_cov112-Isochrysis_galbana.AAC.4
MMWMHTQRKESLQASATAESPGPRDGRKGFIPSHSPRRGVLFVICALPSTCAKCQHSARSKAAKMRAGCWLGLPPSAA